MAASLRAWLGKLFTSLILSAGWWEGAFSTSLVSEIPPSIAWMWDFVSIPADMMDVGFVRCFWKGTGVSRLLQPCWGSCWQLVSPWVCPGLGCLE